jgi:hypothetical protein
MCCTHRLHTVSRYTHVRNTLKSIRAGMGTYMHVQGCMFVCRNLTVKMKVPCDNSVCSGPDPLSTGLLAPERLADRMTDAPVRERLTPLTGIARHATTKAVLAESCVTGTWTLSSINLCTIRSMNGQKCAAMSTNQFAHTKC